MGPRLTRDARASLTLAVCAALAATIAAQEAQLDGKAEADEQILQDNDDPAVRRALAHPVLSWKMKIRKQTHAAPRDALSKHASTGSSGTLLQEEQQRDTFSSVSEATSSASSTFFSSSASWSTAANGMELHSEKKSSSREGWTSDGKSGRQQEASAKSWVVGSDKQLHKGLAKRWQRNEVRHGDNIGVTSFDSQEAVSKDHEGKLHSGGRFLRSEAVSDGVEVRKEEVSKDCMDGDCKESVTPHTAALVEGRPDDAIPDLDVGHGEAATAAGLELGAQTDMPLLTVDKMKRIDQELNGIVKHYLKESQLASSASEDVDPEVVSEA